uniref:Uncharacterized protein n=1 Tax=viral metagenome TaxID=1070528 RepID=A0A6C0DF41_9ZZZZ
MKLWPIMVLTLGMFMWIGYTVATVERKTIMENWDIQRCNPFIMFAAYYLRPQSDPRDDVTFAIDNFSFCMKTLAQKTLEIAMAPVYAVFGSQLSVSDMLSSALDGIRALLKNLYDAFLSFMEPFLKRFEAVTYQVGIVTQHLRASFQRVNAALVSFVFVGLTTVQGIQNFIDTVINVILIICGIMLAIIIILFFILFPFIPLIVSVLTIITAVLVGSASAAANDMIGGFCFVPDTPIQMASGTTKPISEIKLGDQLAQNTVVEGLFVFDGSDSPLYSLDGIRVSGTHLVKDEQGSWRSVSSDPRAMPLEERSDRLYCLNTSSRQIPILNNKGIIQLFRDWEEIDEEDETGQAGWDSLVAAILSLQETQSAGTFSLMSPRYRVIRNKQPVRLDQVLVGDFIESEQGVTRVLGLVKGHIQGASADLWTASCIKKEGSTWIRCSTVKAGTDLLEGVHLITESGVFQVYNAGLFRDFTEVGVHRIHETYPYVASRLSIFSPAANKSSSPITESPNEDSIFNNRASIAPRRQSGHGLLV